MDGLMIFLSFLFLVAPGMFLIIASTAYQDWWENELDKFVKVIKQHLDENGKFIGVNTYMTMNIERDYKKYGFIKNLYCGIWIFFFK